MNSLRIVAMLITAGLVFAGTAWGSNKAELKITILYDNYIHDRNLDADWGFLCLVEGLSQNILFDMGGNGSILILGGLSR